MDIYIYGCIYIYIYIYIYTYIYGYIYIYMDVKLCAGSVEDRDAIVHRLSPFVIETNYSYLRAHLLSMTHAARSRTQKSVGSNSRGHCGFEVASAELGISSVFHGSRNPVIVASLAFRTRCANPPPQEPIRMTRATIIIIAAELFVCNNRNDAVVTPFGN